MAPAVEGEETAVTKVGHLGRSRYVLPILLFSLTLLVYTVRLRYIGVGDTEPAELLPISIIYEHDLDFDEFAAEGGPLQYWLREVNGRIVSNYTIVPGLLNLPVYLVAYVLGVNLLEQRFVLSALSSAIISSLSVVFMYLCLRRVCRTQKAAVFFALTYAFATTVWSVTSRGLWQHGPSLLFINVSLFLLLSRNRRLIPYAGFFLGMAVFNRPANIMLALPLTFYVFFNHRAELKKYIMLAALPALLMASYSYVYWGSPLSTGEGGGLSLSHTFSGDIVIGLSGLLFSPSRGLLVFSPIFIFSFVYLAYALVSRKVAPIYKYLSIAVIALLLLHAKNVEWWGGMSFGYRMVTELVPMLVILLAASWGSVILQLRIVFVLLLVVSVYGHFLGAFYYPCGFNDIARRTGHTLELLFRFPDTELTMCTERFWGDARSLLQR